MTSLQSVTHDADLHDMNSTDEIRHKADIYRWAADLVDSLGEEQIRVLREALGSENDEVPCPGGCPEMLSRRRFPTLHLSGKAHGPESEHPLTTRDIDRLKGEWDRWLKDH